MDVVLPELVSCELHSYGLIEPALTSLFIEAVAPDAVVFDVGAHLGYYSLLAAGLGGRVHAFEPARSTARLLERNVGDRATVAVAGLWSEETTLELKDFGPAHSAVNTFVSVRDEGLSDPDGAYPAPVTTLDRYVEDTNEVPSLIKVDAEGAELQVLRGAETTIRDARPVVTIEVGDTRTDRTSRPAIDFAMSLGLVPYEFGRDGLRPHEPRTTYGYGNIVLASPSTPVPDLSSSLGAYTANG